MKFSRISWTDHTHNHWIGCTKIRPGCERCYACRDFAERKRVVEWGLGKPRKLTSKPNRLRPLRWNEEAKRRGVRYRVFANSLSDVFDHEVPDEWRWDLFLLIRRTPHLDWMLLTKRPYLMERWFKQFPDPDWPWPHVALGVTIEKQAYAKHGQTLGEIPAARRFLSLEPLLGLVDIEPAIDLVDEVIVGGETGRGARQMKPDWVRSVRDACMAHGKTLVFKAWGDWRPDRLWGQHYLHAGWSPTERRGGRLLDNALWLGARSKDSAYVRRAFETLHARRAP